MARGGARPGAGRRKGAPNKATVIVKDAAQAFTADALETLAKIMKDTEAPAAARVAAANALLDRGHGKPKQSVDVDGVVNGALTVTYVGASAGPLPAPSEEDYETDE